MSSDSNELFWLCTDAIQNRFYIMDNLLACYPPFFHLHPNFLCALPCPLHDSLFWNNSDTYTWNHLCCFDDCIHRHCTFNKCQFWRKFLTSLLYDHHIQTLLADNHILNLIKLLVKKMISLVASITPKAKVFKDLVLWWGGAFFSFPALVDS